jgi:membrane protein DedA with SNARE-associated domain
MDGFIANYINSWGQWLYIGVIIAMLIDGNITVLLVGFLASGGAINPFYGILACIAGGLIEQLVLFWIGLKLKGNNSLAWAWLTKAGSQFDKHFERRPKLALFITKFIYGIHRNSLVRVASLGVSLKKFLKISVPVLIPWVLILFIIGYTVSKPVFLLLQNYLRYLEFGLLGLLIAIILLERFVLSGELKKIWEKI